LTISTVLMILAGAGCAIVCVDPLASWPLLLRAGIVMVLVGVGSAGVMVPVAITQRARQRELQEWVEHVAEGRSLPALSKHDEGLAIASAVVQLVDRCDRRERKLRDRLREAEVGERVAHVEARRLRAALGLVRDGVVLTDPFGEVQLANRAAAELLDLDLAADTGRPWHELVTHPGLKRLIVEACDEPDPRVGHRVELGWAHVDGAPDRRAGARVVAIADQEGRIDARVFVFERIVAEAAALDHGDELVARASLELHDPIAVIRGAAQDLLDGTVADLDSRHRYYRIIQREADRMGHLIGSLWNLSRIREQSVPIQWERVDLRDVVRRAVAMLELGADQKSIALDIDLADDLFLEGDAELLREVIANLLSNALEHTPTGGRVAVDARIDASTRRLVLTVSDTGPGIPRASLPRVFERGLGLSLCKHIVERVLYGGIEASSEPGSGSRFQCTIPLEHAARAA
jgi:two-component system phosphate regulon sensor histidine kinase PhoR